jgi:hypothetical protein
MQAWPQDLVAEIVIVLSEFVIRDPNRGAVIFLHHTVINVPTERFFERVCVCTKSPDPSFSLEAPLQRFYGVSESTIAVGVRFNMILATNWGVRMGPTGN